MQVEKAGGGTSSAPDRARRMRPEVAAGDTTRSRPHVREAIMDAAVELFYQRGYQATGVQDIVDRAGYTKGALYHYFKSKEDLLLEIHDVFMSYGLERGREIIRGDHSASTALSMLMRELMRQVKLYRPHMTIFFQETRLIDFERYPEAKAKRDEWEDIVVEIIDRGVMSGEFRSDLASAKVASYGITGMCVWAYHWFKEDGALDPDTITDMFAAIVLGGLRRSD